MIAFPPPSVALQRPADTLACEPADAAARPVRLTAGEYRFAVVPTRRLAGRERAVVGRLWLWRASPDDRSPATRKRAVAPPAGLGPIAFVGATDADLARAGVDLDSTRPLVFPPPTSRDPVYPGLYVERATPPGRGWVLLVGTQNMRAPLDGMVVDGPGAHFSIDASDGRGGFVGNWGPYGRRGSAGHFCARHVGPAPKR